MGKPKKEPRGVMTVGGEVAPYMVEGIGKWESVEVVAAAPNDADQITNKEIRAAVEIPKGFQAALDRGETLTVSIYMYQGEIKSSFGADRIEKFLRGYRDNVSKKRLAARHLPPALLKPFDIKQQNVAPPEKVGGTTFGGLTGYIAILLCMTGATYPPMLL